MSKNNELIIKKDYPPKVYNHQLEVCSLLNKVTPTESKDSSICGGNLQKGIYHKEYYEFLYVNWEFLCAIMEVERFIY